MNRALCIYFCKRLAYWALLVVPGSAALVWSVHPALSAVVTLWTTAPLPIGDADWQKDPPLLEQKRALQQVLLDRGLYIPLSDIISGSPPLTSGLASQNKSLLMQKVCGPSTLYVWVPLKFRAPLWGELVWEWCWKPPVKKTQT